MRLISKNLGRHWRQFLRGRAPYKWTLMEADSQQMADRKAKWGATKKGPSIELAAHYNAHLSLN